MSRTARRLLTATALVAGLALTSSSLSVAEPAGPAAAQDSAHRHFPRIVEQWADAWNRGDANALSALFTADGTYTDHAFQASFTGRAGVKQWVELTKRAITPLHATVHTAFRSGDQVAVTWTFSGTSTDQNPFTPPNNPAGRSFAVKATSVFTLHRDHIATADDYYNLADLLRQVGLPAGPFTPPGQG
ncbi:nuclear transport factor 2 family protein [Actinokineospora terrae]|uniref:SnoaL-like domain-containing protein n=1 Tax=Actinokineospora terrae TaxID=155974 RepID=A0A1H9TBB0_9PSEU|nr:nuclear transport factor 2 family protein [Actinokineospora terrae]SER94069.1 conserved hypothetical protein, steroid delta-isomerase-related/conserved hypothetical protein [Actinokineospora terrae]